MKPCQHAPRPTVSKVIIAGFPMRYCATCGNVWGFWSWAAAVFPWRAIMTYHGSYWRGLVHWMLDR